MEEFWSIIKKSLPIMLALLLLTYILKIKSKINDKTSRKILNFEKSGKYIKDIFIELDETKEVLRYFIYGKKRIPKLIRDFNFIYDTRNGHILSEYDKTNDSIFGLKYTATRNDIKQLPMIIKENLEIHERQYNCKYKNLSDDYVEYYVSVFNSLYFKNKLEKIRNYCSAMLSKSLLLLGSAGNGKTNLLLNIAELAINQNHQCIFINSKDVQSEDIYDYFISQFDIPSNHTLRKDMILSVNNAILCFRRKYQFIIIDALNENDDKKFKSSLIPFLNKMNKYSRVKILLSCRSEYYNERYNDIFDSEELHHKPFLLEMNNAKYDIRAKERLLHVYKEHFNFRGKISDTVETKLYSQLLLMRIFFEAYKDSNINILTLCKQDVFKKYLDLCRDKYNSRNKPVNANELHDILYNIVKLMIDNSYFNKIILSTAIEKQIDTIVDETIILYETCEVKKGITSVDANAYSFIFDDLRDFIIASYMVDKLTCSEIFKVVDKFADNNLTPLEGVLTFLYIYYRTGSNYNMCEELINRYLVKDSFLFSRLNNNTMINYDYRVNIVFSSNIPFDKINFKEEVEFIYNNLLPYNTNIVHIFNIIVNSEETDGVYNFEILADWLLQNEDKIDMLKLFNSLNSEINNFDAIIEKLYSKHKNNNNQGSNAFNQFYEFYKSTHNYVSNIKNLYINNDILDIDFKLRNIIDDI